MGLEPTTLCSLGEHSTNWATRAVHGTLLQQRPLCILAFCGMLEWYPSQTEGLSWLAHHKLSPPSLFSLCRSLSYSTTRWAVPGYSSEQTSRLRRRRSRRRTKRLRLRLKVWHHILHITRPYDGTLYVIMAQIHVWLLKGRSKTTHVQYDFYRHRRNEREENGLHSICSTYVAFVPHVYIEASALSIARDKSWWLFQPHSYILYYTVWQTHSQFLKSVLVHSKFVFLFVSQEEEKEEKGLPDRHHHLHHLLIPLEEVCHMTVTWTHTLLWCHNTPKWCMLCNLDNGTE